MSLRTDRMASIYLLTLLIVGAASGELFQLKQEYKYRYEAWQTLGVRNTSSVLAMKANVTLQVISNNVIDMKLTDLEWAHADSFQWARFTSQPPLRYHKITGENKTMMELPFRVILRQGLVDRFYLHKRDSWISGNLKRACAQLLQLDVKASHALRPPFRLPSPSQSSSWTVMESGVGGECETLYETTLSPPGKMRFYRKQRDYSRCSHRPEYRHLMPIVTNSSSDYDIYQTGSNQSSSIVYKVKQEQEEFTIKYIHLLSSKHVYPYKVATEQMQVWVNQTMEFLLKRPISSAMSHELSQNYKEYKNLSCVFPQDERAEQNPLEHPPTPNPFLPAAFDVVNQWWSQPQKTQDEVVRMVKELDEFLKQDYHRPQQDAINKTLKIQQLISTLTKTQLSAIYQQLQEPSQNAIYVDALCSAGLPTAISVAMNAIEHKNLPEHNVLQCIRKVPFTIKTPVAPILQRITDVWRSARVQSSPKLRSTWASALGNMYYHVCFGRFSRHLSYPTGKHRQYCDDKVISQIRQFVQQLQQQISKTPKPEKFAYINALSNIGSKEICSTLLPLASQQSDRQTAIFALSSMHRIAKEQKCPVRNLTSILFHDITLHPTVRQAALKALIRTVPPRAYMHRIALSTRQDPSLKVKQTVYQCFWSLSSVSNIWSPPDQALRELSLNAKALLPLILKPQGTPNVDQYYYVLTRLFPDLLGQNVEFSRIPSESFDTVINHYIGDVETEKFRMLFQQNNILDVLMRMWNQPYRLPVNQMSAKQRSSPRDISMVKTWLPQVMQLINANHNRKEVTPYSYLSYKLLSSMEYIHMLNASSLIDMMKWLGQEKSQYSRVFSYIPTIQEATTVCSEMGLPTAYSRRGAIAYTLASNINLGLGQKGVQLKLTKAQVQAQYDQFTESCTADPFRGALMCVSHENHLHTETPQVSVQGEVDMKNKQIDMAIELKLQQPKVRIVDMNSRFYLTSQKGIYEDSESYRVPVPSKTFKSYKTESSKFQGLYFQMSYQSVYRSIPYKQWYQFSPPTCDHAIRVYLMEDNSEPKRMELSLKFKADPWTAPTKQPKPEFITQQHWQKYNQAQIDARHEAEVHLKPLQDPVSRNISLVLAVTMHSSTGQNQYTASLQALNNPKLHKTALRVVAKAPKEWACFLGDYEAKSLSEDRQMLQQNVYHIPFKGQFGFGEQTCQSSKIDVKGSVVSDPDPRKKPAQYRDKKRECERDEKLRFPFSPVCQTVKDMTTAINKIEVEATWTNLPVQLRNVSRQIDDALKNTLYKYMSNNPYQSNPDKQVKATILADYYWETVSAHLQKPYETTKFENIAARPVLTQAYLTTVRRPVAQKVLDAFYGKDRSLCAVNLNATKTFDNKVYNISLPQHCRTLLMTNANATRASASSWSQQPILVFGQQKPHGQEVSIEVAHHTIVVEQLNNQIVVRVDNKEVPHNVEYKCFNEPRGVCVRRIPNEVHIHVTNSNVEVKVTRNSILVYSSQPYNGHVSKGWCGDMNGEWLAEAEDLQGCVHSEPRSLLKALQFPPLSGEQQSCQPITPSPCVNKDTYRKQYADYFRVDSRPYARQSVYQSTSQPLSEPIELERW